MKKSIISGVSLLGISLMLFGCSNNKSDKAKDTSSKDAKIKKIASSKKAASESKAKESSKKKAESESKAKAESESKAKENATAQSQENNANSKSSNTPDFSLDIHSFINKYGMSEAAYRSEYMGMSSEEALYATPDSHETSGELQSENMYRNGQDPYASNDDDDDDEYEEFEGGQKYVPGKSDDWYTEQYWKHHPEEEAEAEAEEDDYDDEGFDEDYEDEDY